MIFQPATLKFPGFVPDMADASSHGCEHHPGGTDPQQMPGVPKAVLFLPITLPKKCTGDSSLQSIQLPTCLKHQGVFHVLNVWGAGIPKRGVSQSDTLKTPFQTLVWLVPGTALWSLSATQHSIVQHRMGAKTLPKTCSHECLPPAEATSRFPLAESQTPCPQQYIHFRYPPPAHFPWDIAGCFCLLLSPASPRAAPPFPHINR